MSADASADAVLASVGGPDNVMSLSRCLVRLRLRLRDPGAVRLDELDALPQVAIAVWQGDELHIAPVSGLDELHERIARACR